jgi:hypothetical protein
VSTDDVPPLELLVLLTIIARKLGVSVATIHRMRLDKRNPLICWRVAGRWRTTEVAVKDAIRRRTAGFAAGTSTEIPAHRTAAERQQASERAVARCRSLGC